MANKKMNSFGGLVFSTDPNFKLPSQEINEADSLAPNLQKIKIKLDKKHRGGKVVTLVEGFIGKQSEKDELGKKLKSYCGTGGSVKDDEIMIQGDNRDKVLQWLLKNNFTQAKRIN